jgi:rhodanese-related sulfurtransferase
MVRINNVDSATLKKWLENDEVVIIDVREVEEYQDCSIENSRHLPLSQVTLDKAHLPEHKNKKIVFQCKSGKRSMMAYEKIIGEGVDFDIWNLEGGIESWKGSGLPTIPTKKIISVDRQVQLVLSLLLLSSMALYHNSGNTIYLIVPLLLGLALLSASITGFCLLKKIIENLPLNK